MPQQRPGCKSGDAIELVEFGTRAALENARAVAIADRADEIASVAWIVAEERGIDEEANHITMASPFKRDNTPD